MEKTKFGGILIIPTLLALFAFYLALAIQFTFLANSTGTVARTWETCDVRDKEENWIFNDEITPDNRSGNIKVFHSCPCLMCLDLIGCNIYVCTTLQLTYIHALKSRTGKNVIIMPRRWEIFIMMIIMMSKHCYKTEKCLMMILSATFIHSGSAFPC